MNKKIRRKINRNRIITDVVLSTDRRHAQNIIRRYYGRGAKILKVTNLGRSWKLAFCNEYEIKII